MHPESGEDAVIVPGTAGHLRTAAQLRGVVAALSAKCTGEADRLDLLDDPDFGVVYAIRPSAMSSRLTGCGASQRRRTAC